MTDAPRQDPLRERVRDYYRRLGPAWDRALAGRGDLAFWEDVVRGSGGATPPRVLEVGAGAGRATGSLARCAGLLVAFDLLPEMLRRARHRLRGREEVLLVVADVREFAFRTRFELAVAANDPLAHLIPDEDRDRALRRISEHLVPEGRFVLDALWLSPARERAAATPSGLREERAAGGAGGAREDEADVGEGGGEGAGLRVREVWRCDPVTRTCRVRYRYLQGGRTVARATFAGRYWSEPELRDRLRAAGMEPVATYGDYRRGPWDPAASEHLVVEARRA